MQFVQLLVSDASYKRNFTFCGPQTQAPFKIVDDDNTDGSSDSYSAYVQFVTDDSTPFDNHRYIGCSSLSKIYCTIQENF